ncbi:MAG: Gfo/Idh/MocA family oxidoreductase [SAR202 cluster bacterium]|nr:Gfo/Idh/MocA family oxidoreductase [SAR202 cluster bacterium]
MPKETLRVGIIGAGRWAQFAHLPAWSRQQNVKLVWVCDIDEALAGQMSKEYNAPHATTNWQKVVSRPDLDIIDICTPSQTHYEIAQAAIASGKHVLCEKPVNYDFRKTLALSQEAKRKRLKTKLGFTFRYTPGVRYAKSLIDEGFVGRPLIFNGYEQNSQWLNPQTPLRDSQVKTEKPGINVASLEGYGAPIIDISRWWVGADYTSVVGTMRNFIPERAIRGKTGLHRVNIDDGDVFLAEYANGAFATIQTSFCTVGNFPGVEARFYGDKGAIIVRVVEEFGVPETVRAAKPDSIEYKQLDIPRRFFPRDYVPGESARNTFYTNLVTDFVEEIHDGGARNQGNFDDGAWVQEMINAVEISHHQRRWVDLPLPR